MTRTRDTTQRRARTRLARRRSPKAAWRGSIGVHVAVIVHAR
jgi:hypothetical protein